MKFAPAIVRLVALACAAYAPCALPAQDRQPAKSLTPLPQAHAHNDYLHERTLQGALDHGFCSVEADIFLTPEGLLVAHEKAAQRPDRTLKSLYLEPLRQRVKANGGKVHRDGPTFYLLIDVKSAADETYAALDKVLAGYADILTTTENGHVEQGAVTAILSGNRAITAVSKQTRRYIAIDGRLDDLKGDAPATLIPWISANWTQVFKWAGEGQFPADEKQKLVEIVSTAHTQGRKVRFWATPEKPTVWDELLAAGVDFINTDKLDQLRDFLQARSPN